MALKTISDINDRIVEYSLRLTLAEQDEEHFRAKGIELAAARDAHGGHNNTALHHRLNAITLAFKATQGTIETYSAELISLKDVLTAYTKFLATSKDELAIRKFADSIKTLDADVLDRMTIMKDSLQHQYIRINNARDIVTDAGRDPHTVLRVGVDVPSLTEQTFPRANLAAATPYSVTSSNSDPPAPPAAPTIPVDIPQTTTLTPMQPRKQSKGHKRTPIQINPSANFA
jgi:hypothetical protein